MAFRSTNCNTTQAAIEGQFQSSNGACWTALAYSTKTDVPRDAGFFGSYSEGPGYAYGNPPDFSSQTIKAGLIVD